MRISERGQITIPKELRERFGLHHNVEVDVLIAHDKVCKEAYRPANGAEAGHSRCGDHRPDADAADCDIDPVLATRLENALNAGDHHSQRSRGAPDGDI